jgi:HAD superfamily hydrolase (TIGR01450 family)
MHRLKNIKHLALDLDGTLYLGGRVFDCTLGFLARLRELGIGHTFFTNNSSKSTRQYVQKLGEMGIAATSQDLYSSTHATIDYLRQTMPGVKRLYVLGTQALREEFREAGFHVVQERPSPQPSPGVPGEGDREPDAVIVGYDTSLIYERACEAAWWISRGKPFLATNPDRVCPTDHPTVLVDCGAMCAMLTHATGIAPHAVLGKPNPMMLSGVMQRHNLAAAELGVVGDRIYTDIAMAHAAGAMGILVLSGEATREQAEASTAAQRPDLIVNDVGELGNLLAQTRNEKAHG